MRDAALRAAHVLHEVAPGAALPDRVEHAGRVPLHERQRERREVAGVDELQGRGRVPEQHEPLVAREVVGPEGEAVRVVVRSHDEARTHDRGALAVDLAHDLLAQDLEAAVRLARDLLHGGVREPREGVVLRDALAGEVLVDADGGDEQVAPRVVPQELSAGTHDARHVARDVHDGVPVAVPEGRHVAVPVTVEPLHRVRKVVRGASAREGADLMPAREGLQDDVPTDELRAAQNEDAHGDM